MARGRNLVCPVNVPDPAMSLNITELDLTDFITFQNSLFRWVKARTFGGCTVISVKSVTLERIPVC